MKKKKRFSIVRVLLAVGLGLVAIIVLGIFLPVPDAGTGPSPDFDLDSLLVPREELVAGGPPKDGIPALTDPVAVPGAAAGFLRAGDAVIGVVLGGVARAYPIRILNWHEVVNDRIADDEVTVTWCPLAGSAVVFDAGRGAERDLFGVSGLLHQSTLVLYDRRTESLWSQLAGRAISGARAGETLPRLPCLYTTWEEWFADHPQTTVLAPPRDRNRDYGRDPYGAYASEDAILFPVSCPPEILGRFPPKTPVLGIATGAADWRAYPLRLLAGRTIAERIGGREIRVTADADGRGGAARDADGREIPSVRCYWFAWASVHPGTTVFDGANDGDR